MVNEQAIKYRPMPMDVKTTTFIAEWKKCILDDSFDTTDLFAMLEPFLEHWEKQLRKQDPTEHINYSTLCSLLSDDMELSLNKISRWLSWADSTSTVKNELAYIFLERIRKFKYYPSLARPIMVEYVIARDFKLALKHYITGIWRKVHRDALLTAEYGVDFDIELDYSYPDPLIYKQLEKLNNWQQYLLKLIIEQYSSKERSELTLIHRRNLYIEEKKIWDLIKLKLLDS